MQIYARLYVRELLYYTPSSWVSVGLERKEELTRQRTSIKGKKTQWLRAGSPFHHKVGTKKAGEDLEGCWRHPAPEHDVHGKEKEKKTYISSENHFLACNRTQ
eukprot:231717-Pelagomonas_calceolata.AAC.1